MELLSKLMFDHKSKILRLLMQILGQQEKASLVVNMVEFNKT